MDQKNSSLGIQKAEGLQILSFEGNTNIGDKGAAAVANLIRTPSNNTKRLTKVSLSECGLTNIGFEELKNALTQRANLAQIANLSHVNVTIDRNNIERNESQI